MQADHPSHAASRWILRDVEAPTDEEPWWKCRACPYTAFSHKDMLDHKEGPHHKKHHAAFCCLYCAEAHHTRDGLKEHTKKHLKITDLQHSPSVCIIVKRLERYSASHNPHDEARRARRMIAQDLETGATLPVYSGGDLGEINRLSVLLCLVILSCLSS